MADLTAMMQAAAGNAGGDANFIEDVFSCFLYTGNGSTQTITNGIDLAGEGGLVWIKQRNAAVEHFLYDTTRGVTKSLSSDDTTSEYTNIDTLTAFGSTGFTLGSSNFVNGITSAPRNYVSWTFRRQPKFFDVVTYTGDGLSATQIPHSLGSVPGCVIVKPISTTGAWGVWHRGNGSTDRTGLSLNSVSASVNTGHAIGFTATYFTPRLVEDADYIPGNINGVTYVAYLFAHDAGGFGLISCGSVTRSGSGVINVNLGYEPQWVLFKSASNANNWRLFDVMRGMPVTGAQRVLNANLSDAEGGFSDALFPTATGFAVNQDSGIFGGAVGSTSIYIAIRRGPMKVPTTGTSVFEPVARTGTGATATVSSPNFPVDLAIIRNRPDAQDNKFADRLRGRTLALVSNSAAAEGTDVQGVLGFDVQTGVTVGTDLAYNKNATAMINYLFRRAPGTFDQVCYTGNSAASNNQNHNLGVVPEMCILKARSGVFATDNWQVVHKNDGVTAKTTALNLTNATLVDSVMSANFTSTFFRTADATWPFTRANFNGDTYVAYLFATCPGVSKVGSYTGTGTTQTINCGFTGGARFVLIKRTDSTGNWYVWDSARGIVAGNDPYLLLNSTAAEVTNTDFVDTASVGFEISSTAPAEINASGGTYIFLAIA